MSVLAQFYNVSIVFGSIADFVVLEPRVDAKTGSGSLVSEMERNLDDKLDGKFQEMMVFISENTETFLIL